MRTATVMLAVGVVLLAAPAWADFKAGQEAFEQGDYATALKELRPLAEQGDAPAQNTLAWMYLNGHGVPQDDKEALRWVRRAAEQGDAEAQLNLGNLYDLGRGVPQDYAQAAYWFRRAAEQGFIFGQYMLGKAYLNGHGVTMSKVQAHMWFNIAGAQGDEYSRKQRYELARRMTHDQIEEAHRLAREWKPKGK